MRTSAFAEVSNQPHAARPAENKPTVQNRIRQSAVAVVTGNQEVKRLCHRAALYGDFRNLRPREWPRRDCLVLSVHSQGVVSARAAEQLSVIRVRNVNARPWIDQKSPAIERHSDAERVSVTVATVTGTLRSRIDNHLVPDGVCARQNVKPTCLKRL